MNQNGYELRIEVRISDYRQGGGLSLSENMMIPAADFMEMAGILGKFHEALEAVKAVQEKHQ